jgi:hypothetical protein
MRLVARRIYSPRDRNVWIETKLCFLYANALPFFTKMRSETQGCEATGALFVYLRFEIRPKLKALHTLLLPTFFLFYFFVFCVLMFPDCALLSMVIVLQVPV